MNKLRWLVLPLALAVLLIGGVFWTAGAARTAPVEATVVAKAVTAPTAPTLTLAISDTALALNTSATLDLDDSTWYSGTGTLTYTAETAPSELFTLTLAGRMLTITSTSTLTGGVFVVDVEVTDGVYTATDPFTVTVEEAPPPPELTLAIPDRPLALNGAETLDLWTYTTYSGDPADLVYTVTTPASALFAAGVTGTHYLNIASTSATMGGEFVVDVSVGDGLSTTADAFTVTVTGVPTLSLSIPDGIGVPVEGQRTLDLWDFTTYHLSDKSGLVYTVTQLNGTYSLDIALAGSHYMSMTSLGYSSGSQASVEVEVSDGDLYFLLAIEVVTDYPPILEFHGDHIRVAPNPLKAPTGAVTYLIDDEYKQIHPLEDFTWGYAYASSFELVGDVAPQLGAAVITGTINCSYEYCFYLTFTPPVGAVGTYQVEVQAWNYSYMTDTDILTVTIMPQVYLPLVIGGYPPVATLKPIDNPDGDGVYYVEWNVTGGGHIGFELQRDTNPQFTNPTTFQQNSYSTSYSAETLTPGTYYWRIRPYGSTENFAWSNVVAVNVGNFAYLYVEPLCAFGLRVELFGPINTSIDYESGWCGDVDYWRSVPAGTYTTRLSWLGGSIVDNVGGTYLGNGGEYIIVADQRPPSWQPY